MPFTYHSVAKFLGRPYYGVPAKVEKEVEGVLVRGPYDYEEIESLPEQDREYRGYDLDIDIDGHPEGFEAVFCMVETECFDFETSTDYFEDLPVYYFVRKGVLA